MHAHMHTYYLKRYAPFFCMFVHTSYRWPAMHICMCPSLLCFTMLSFSCHRSLTKEVDIGGKEGLVTGSLFVLGFRNNWSPVEMTLKGLRPPRSAHKAVLIVMEKVSV